MAQANTYLGVLQYTEVNNGVYTHGLDGYIVVVTDAPIQHRGGVAVFYPTLPRFMVEAHQNFGTNIVSSQLVPGGRRWYIAGCFLAPGDASTIDSIVTAIGQRPHGNKLLVSGYFNEYLSGPEGSEREKYIVAEDLEDMSAHFLLCQRSWAWDGRTWSMVHMGRKVQSRTY